MTWFDGLILGLVQGLTEFLPVSSSGHMMIARDLLGVDIPGEDAFLSFEIAAHTATVLATIVVFRKDIWRLLCGLLRFSNNDETDYVLKIAVSMIPVFIVGMFFKDQVEALFGGLAVVGWALLATALILFLSDTTAMTSLAANSGKTSRSGISYLQAFMVGCAQAVAVIPGLSRSGSTIGCGLLCGVERSKMAEFSFLMVLVPILGEAFLELIGGGFVESVAIVGTLPLVCGFVAAFLSGLMACRVMVALVKRTSLKWFALYCAVVGAAVLVIKYFVL